MTIVADDEVLHGLPRIEGTRISVIHVYDMVVGGAAPAEVADTLDLALGRVYEALAYYYDHPDERRERNSSSLRTSGPGSTSAGEKR